MSVCVCEGVGRGLMTRGLFAQRFNKFTNLRGYCMATSFLHTSLLSLSDNTTDLTLFEVFTYINEPLSSSIVYLFEHVSTVNFEEIFEAMV